MHDPWRVWLAVALLFAFASGFLVLASRRGRLALVASTLLAISSLGWALDLAAVSAGYRDADGFVDCARACSGTQIVAAVGFFAPPLLVSLSGLALLVAAVRRWQRRTHR